MSSTQTAVFLLLLISICTAALLFVPAEIPDRQEAVSVPNPTVTPVPVQIPGNATVMRTIMMWDQKRDYSGSIIASYGATPLELWKWTGKGDDKKTVSDWIYGVMTTRDEFWKSIEAHYESIENGPVNLIEFGGSAITIHVADTTTQEEIDRIYSWWKTSLAAAGIPALPTEFRYGGSVYLTGTNICGKTVITTDTGEYSLYECSSLLYGKTNVQRPPGPIRSVLLLLCIAGVATVGFSRMMELPKDPASRPRKIAVFITEHPGCAQKEITDATGFSRGSVLYNLKLLQRKKIVRKSAYFGSIRYFPAAGGTSAMEKILRTILTQERPAQILRGIAETPGIEKEELAKQIGIAKTTLAWHLRRFVKTGLILKMKEGWALTPEAALVWEQLNA